MISKLITGNGFGGAVRYSTKYGKDPDGTLHKLLDVSGVTFDYDDRGELTINPRKVGWDFRQQTLGYNPDTRHYRPIRKSVYHWILSWKEGEREIPPEEMCEVAKEFLKRIGFTNTQYVISAHYDKDNQHLHIVANIVNNEGKRIVTQGMIDNAKKVAAAITKERGYAWGEPANEETLKSAKKPHEKVRYTIEPIISKALQTSLTDVELVAKLKASQISTIIRPANDGKRGGISFAYTYRGVLHTFRGSSVDRKLSYTNIQKQLEANRAKVEQLIPKEKILALYPAVIGVSQFVTSIYTKYSSFNVRKELKDGLRLNYERLNNHYSELRALKLEEHLDSEELKSVYSAGVILINALPAIGFCLMIMSQIIEGDYKKKSMDEKKVLLAQINNAKKYIADFKIIHEGLKQIEGMNTLLEYYGFDLNSLNDYYKPIDECIEKADKKDALSKTTLPDVIVVTRENYASVSLPDGFEPCRFGQDIVVGQIVVPEEGLVIYKKIDQYATMPKKKYDRIKGNKERLQKWTDAEKKPKQSNGFRTP